MTPRERLYAAMHGLSYDRVPFMCQMSVGHMLRQVTDPPVDVWNDGEVFARVLVDLRQRYGFDGILVSLHGHDPRWIDVVARREMTPDGEVVVWTNGQRLLHRPDDLPEVLSEPAEPFSDPAQIPQPLSYIPVSQGLRFAVNPLHRFDVLRSVRALAGPDVSVHGEVTSPFDYLLDALGHEAALMLLIDEPERAEVWLGRFAEGVAEIAAGMVHEDIDAVKLSSPFAGAGFISRDHYERFVLPYEQRVVEAIQQHGTPAYVHTCGAIGDRLDLMERSGALGLECLDPPPLGTVELSQAFEVLGGRMFVKGNVDSVHSLLLASDAEVESDATQRLQLGKRYGRFILSTACSIAPAVRPERIAMLRRILEEQGQMK